MKILTWSDIHKNGAFQKLIDTRLFSDMLTVKPTFSFAFTNMQYIEQSNVFTIDGVPMTVEQKLEVLTAIDKVVPPLTWYVAMKTNEIENKHDEIVKQMIGNVSNTEFATWPKQIEQAIAWKANNAVVTPLIDGLFTGRAVVGETKLILVDKIIENANNYERTYAPVLGNYQGKMKAITAATTATAVDAIAW